MLFADVLWLAAFFRGHMNLSSSIEGSDSAPESRIGVCVPPEGLVLSIASDCFLVLESVPTGGGDCSVCNLCRGELSVAESAQLSGPVAEAGRCISDCRV